MRRVLVAIKRVIDYNVRVRVKPDGSGVVTDGVKLGINPFDEIAIEEAVRQREKGAFDEVVVATIGPADCQIQLRTALAMGADRAILVEGPTGLEPLVVANVILKLIGKETPRLVLLGKQAIDEDNGQTAQMLAALWQRPQATFASSVEIIEESVRVRREVDAGIETVEIDLPAVVSTDLRLNEPRYIKLPDILKAKKKPMETISLGGLGINVTPRVRLLRVEPPVQRQKGTLVASAAELVATLRSKGVL